MIRRPAPKTILLTAVLALTVLGVGFLHSRPAGAISLPDRTIAASADYCDKKANGPLGFFGLEPWYHFMPDSELGTHGEPCAVKCFNIFVQAEKNECGETASDIPGVILVVIDDLLRIAALVAVAYIIIGSFEYAGSRGNSERASSAQSTIISALTGLAIALVAVALISFLGNQLH
jgi:hypothetical protein